MLRQNPESKQTDKQRAKKNLFNIGCHWASFALTAYGCYQTSYYISKQVSHDHSVRMSNGILSTYHSSIIDTNCGPLNLTDSYFCNEIARNEKWCQTMMDLHPGNIPWYEAALLVARIDICRDISTAFSAVDVGTILNFTHPTVTTYIFLKTDNNNEYYISSEHLARYIAIIWMIIYLMKVTYYPPYNPRELFRDGDTFGAFFKYGAFILAMAIIFRTSDEMQSLSEAFHSACNRSSFNFVGNQSREDFPHHPFDQPDPNPLFVSIAPIAFMLMQAVLDKVCHYITQNSDAIVDGISNRCSKLYRFFTPKDVSPTRQSNSLHEKTQRMSF